MPDPAASKFAPGVAAWHSGLGKVPDLVRQARRPAARPSFAHIRWGTRLRVLDVGSGQGTLAIRLAEWGHDVVGVDSSAQLLEVAGNTAAALTPPVRGRLHFEQGDALDLGEHLLGCFDLVCCHGVLMYLPSLRAGVAAVVRAARPGGLVSLLTRNRAGIALRGECARNGVRPSPGSTTVLHQPAWHRRGPRRQPRRGGRRAPVMRRAARGVVRRPPLHRPLGDGRPSERRDGPRRDRSRSRPPRPVPVGRGSHP